MLGLEKGWAKVMMKLMWIAWALGSLVEERTRVLLEKYNRHRRDYYNYDN
jgi:hypothetical protein